MFALFQKTNRLLMPAALLFLSAATALAQEPPPLSGNGDLFPPQAVISTAPEFVLSPADATHPMIRLTPDKSEIVRLEGEARSILVGNPAHLNVLMDSTKTLVLVPQTPGATYFTVLDGTGKVLMQRHVIVASPKENYVRIRRSCAGAGQSCQETSVYYCPDMCHEIFVTEQTSTTPPTMTITTEATEDTPAMTIEMEVPDSVTEPPAQAPAAPADNGGDQ